MEFMIIKYIAQLEHIRDQDNEELKNIVNLRKEDNKTKKQIKVKEKQQLRNIY